MQIAWDYRNGSSHLRLESRYNIECCSGNSDKRRFVCEDQVSNGSAVGALRNFLEGYGKIWTDCLEP